MCTNVPQQVCSVVAVELLSKFSYTILKASCLSTLHTVAIALELKAGVKVLQIDRQQQAKFKFNEGRKQMHTVFGETDRNCLHHLIT